MADYKKYLTKNYWFPTTGGQNRVRANNVKSANSFISPVQFARIRVDIQSLREAISEAEQAFYPHRVKFQRIYQDTILNGQVSAAMQKYKDLTLLKDFEIRNGETVDEKATELLKKEWFYNLLNYCLDAKFFGYSLIGLGDLVDNEFPNVELVKRQNVSPDRHNITSYVYSLSGYNFLDPEALDANGERLNDWLIWVDTPSETGAGNCGYGLLHKIAYYEILMRNNVGYNATANERFGMPLIVGTTTKTDEYERAVYAQALNDIGSSGWLLKDPTDEIVFQESQGGGKGQDKYGPFEERMQKMINKLFFGHADAMDSQTGKLGGEDSAKEAIEAVEKVSNRWMAHIVNTEIIPKLQNLGFPIPIGYTFVLLNNKEKEEAREKEDANNKLTSEIVKNFKDAGYQVDEAYITERTGIPLKKVEIPVAGLNEKVKTKLSNLYGE